MFYTCWTAPYSFCSNSVFDPVLIRYSAKDTALHKKYPTYLRNEINHGRWQSNSLRRSTAEFGDPPPPILDFRIPDASGSCVSSNWGPQFSSHSWNEEWNAKIVPAWAGCDKDDGPEIKWNNTGHSPDSRDQSPDEASWTIKYRLGRG